MKTKIFTRSQILKLIPGLTHMSARNRGPIRVIDGLALLALRNLRRKGGETHEHEHDRKRICIGRHCFGAITGVHWMSRVPVFRQHPGREKRM